MADVTHRKESLLFPPGVKSANIIPPLRLYLTRLWAPQNLPGGIDPELGYTPWVDYDGSQNLPLPPRIYPPLLCFRLPESIPPSQNIFTYLLGLLYTNIYNNRTNRPMQL